MTYVPPTGKPSVATQSAERKAMKDDLELIADVRGGLSAMQKRGGYYLPKYENESPTEYARRVAAAPWRPEFNDSLLSLASKPFSKPVTLPDGTPEPVVKFAEDVDGQGNNIHVFARKLFMAGMADGVSLLIVSYPERTWGPTLADEKAANPKPYWVHVPVEFIIACYTEMKNGKRIINHLRVWESVTERNGFEETIIRQIAVYEPGRWQRWREKESNGQPTAEWILHSEGATLRNGKVPDRVEAVLFFTGERLGDIRTTPPLRDLAFMQIELYRALSRQDEVLTYAGSPMLGTSLAKPADTTTVSVGPKIVLFGDGGGDSGAGTPPWAYVQPDAANIKEVRDQVASVIEDMQRLGMQPTITRSGDVSATETSVVAAKAHSALEAWAIGLKDCLEQAFIFTVEWMSAEAQRAIGNKAIAVSVNTDFGVGEMAAAEANVVLTAEKQNIISKKTARDELARRSILGPSFDPSKEDQQIAEEMQGLEPEEDIDPATGDVIDLNSRRSGT